MNDAAPVTPIPRLFTVARGLIPVLMVIVAAVLPRLGALGSDDALVKTDRAILAEDTRMGRLGALPEFFTGSHYEGRPESGIYRPMVLATLSIEKAVFGPREARSHRIVNLLLHGLASVLLYLLARRLVPDRPVVALLAAVFFAEHPAATEVVGLITARASSGAAVFGVLAIILWRSGRPLAIGLASASLLVAMLFDAVAVMVPIALLLIGIHAPGRARRDRTFKQRMVAPVLFGLAVLVALGMRWGATGSVIPEASTAVLRETDVIHRMIVGSGLLVRNLVALVFPVNLTGDYRADPAWHSGPWSPPFAYLACALLLVGVGAWLVARRPRGVGVLGFLWAVAFLVPVMQIVPLGSLLEDRFLYLPAMGMALAMATGVDRLAGGVAAAGTRARLVGVGLSVVLSLFFALDLKRGAAYADDGALNAHVLKRFPDEAGEPWREEGLAEIRVRLGLHFERKARAARARRDVHGWRRDLGRAEACYARAIELAPKTALPRLRLGSLRVDQRRYEEAITLLQAAKAHPAGDFTLAAIDYDLARALVSREEGRLRRDQASAHDPMSIADAYLRRALRLRPRFPAALYLRGRLLVRYLGAEEEGRTLLRKAVKLDPSLAERARRWLHQPEELAMADRLFRTRQVDEAIERLRRGLTRYDDPTKKALLERQIGEYLLKRVEKFTTAVTPGGEDLLRTAETHAKRALEHWPRFPEGKLLLGYLWWKHLDRPEEGERLMREAARLDSRLAPYVKLQLGE